MHTEITKENLLAFARKTWVILGPVFAFFSLVEGQVLSVLLLGTSSFLLFKNNRYVLMAKEKLGANVVAVLSVVLALTGLSFTSPPEPEVVIPQPVVRSEKHAQQDKVPTTPQEENAEIKKAAKPSKQAEKTVETANDFYTVTTIVDGDTIKVTNGTVVETIRIIGIDAPETQHPSKGVECFGKEATAEARRLLTGKEVILEQDPTQDKRDKYERLLAYVTFKDGTDFGKQLIRNGYAYEYTYNLPYKNQSIYKSAQKYASDNELGLWSPSTCPTEPPSSQPEPTPTIVPVTQTNTPNTQQSASGGVYTNPDGSCAIKGNISSKSKEKIYHVPGQRDYNRTKINTTKGERWFCTEQEATNAGWRKAMR